MILPHAFKSGACPYFLLHFFIRLLTYSAGDHTQGLMGSRQALYHEATSPALSFTFEQCPFQIILVQHKNYSFTAVWIISVL